MGDVSSTKIAEALKGTTSLTSLQMQPLNDLHPGASGMGDPRRSSGCVALVNGTSTAGKHRYIPNSGPRVPVFLFFREYSTIMCVRLYLHVCAPVHLCASFSLSLSLYLFLSLSFCECMQAFLHGYIFPCMRASVCLFA